MGIASLLGDSNGLAGEFGSCLGERAYELVAGPVVLWRETDINLSGFDLGRISPQVNADRRPFRFARGNMEKSLMSRALDDFA